MSRLIGGMFDSAVASAFKKAWVTLSLRHLCGEIHMLGACRAVHPEDAESTGFAEAGPSNRADEETETPDDSRELPDGRDHTGKGSGKSRKRQSKVSVKVKSRRPKAGKVLQRTFAQSDFAPL